MAADQVPVRGAQTSGVNDGDGHVPPFKTYWASRRDLRTKDRKDYYEHFTKLVADGQPPDLQGQLSYGFLMLGELARPRAGNRRKLEEILELFADHYRETKLGEYSRHWLADVHFLRHDFQRGYDVLAPDAMSISTYLTLSSVVSDHTLTPAMLDYWIGVDHKLTKFGADSKSEIDAVVQAYLDEQHQRLGTSVVVDQWRRLDAYDGQAAALIESDFDGLVAQEELDQLVESHRKYWEQDPGEPRRAFANLVKTPLPIDWPVPYVNAYWFAPAIKLRVAGIYRYAENKVRESNNHPRVGEGWISETQLYRQIRDAFPHQRVLFQARPSWLRPQSFDVFLPDVNIAIEYQGIQHTRAVEFFGGEAAFLKTQERDARKRSAAKDNGCCLLEVHPNYVWEQVREQIRAELTNRVNLRSALSDQIR